MAVIALASASGSPGVTTTALGFALHWPRPSLLIEADPTGGAGILPGYFRGTREYDGGLLELALTAEAIPDALAQVTRPIDGTSASYVAGPRSHSHAGALGDIWQQLGEALHDLESTGQDAIIDAGRLGMTGSPAPLLAGADLTVLVSRTSLPALAALRSWTDAIHRGDLGWQETVVLLVGEGAPYGAREVRAALDLPVLGAIDDDPDAAAVLYRGAAPPRHYDDGHYIRSLTTAVAGIHSIVASRRAELATGGPT